jgi:two-component system, NtrC family, sensor kinase
MSPENLRTVDPAEEKPSPADKHRYRRLWGYSVLLMAVVSLTPLIVMTIISSNRYQKTLQVEMAYPVSRLLANTCRALESAIGEHQHALTLLINEKSPQELWSEKSLQSTFDNLRSTFGGFVDLGLIDSPGDQIYYVGPYDLKGKNYKDQPWFHEVCLRDVYVSDVFMGYRNFPHFVIAVRHSLQGGEFYVLRATVDMQLINRQIISLDLGPNSDVFIVNQMGILQTNSRYHGHVLEKASVPMPARLEGTEALLEYQDKGMTTYISYAPIERTPFILMMVHHQKDLMKNWYLNRRDPIWFLVISSILILLVVLGSSTYLVNRIREADSRRTRALHNLEYTNKMASIGRLAANVAHEINNPIAIINEKAGLLKDMVEADPAFNKHDKVLALANSILNSVDRCSTITHRLLGFARRLEAHIERIDLELLLKEVLEFLGKELDHRNIAIKFDLPEKVPSIESDRGLLQQVFLNIINNALAALKEGGQINCIVRIQDAQNVLVSICDNGTGIEPEDLKYIFEPFFSTKGDFGTGLGLSITRDIVEKLGGKITVESRYGEGTCFTVTLPRMRA